MLKLIRYLKQVKWPILAIMLLLVVQAWCDLSLPQYTSDIVDIGIQQGGIEHAAPDQIRDETMENLKLFMEEDDWNKVEAAYTLGEDGIWYLDSVNESALEELDGVFGMPMLMLSAMEAQGMGAATLQAMLSSGQMTLEQLEVMADQAMEKYGSQSDMIVEQKALLFVKEEYAAMGLDLDQIQMNYLLSTGGRMLGIALLMAVAAILVGLLASRTAAQLGMSLRGDVFKTVMSFSNTEIDKFSTASLITRSTNDIQQVQMVVVLMLRIVIYAPILGIGGIIKVATTHTGMEWIIAVAVGSALVLVALLMSLALPKFKRMQTLVDKMNLVSREILTGLPVIRAFSREKHEEKRFDLANLDLKKTQLFTNRVMTFMMPMMMLLMNGVSILIVWNGGHGIDAGTMQVGDMIAFITYTMQIVMSFLMIAMIAIFLPRASVAAGRIDEVLQTKPVIRDKRKVKDNTKEQWQGVVAFEDVSFRYPDAGADVLEHITFTAQPGQTTAIIGSTGSGKSTLLNLIPRFFDVSYGRITMDGVDIRDLSQHKLHELLGYVPQKGVLFSGDIESNLKFGGADITDQAMEEAAEIAQAKGFIDSKPDGYQTPIAQGGTNVSGGQKQRLSIARAIAKNPRVFLFDDSFSALDYKTDVILRRALNEKVKDATVIIVAQRISTILHADQIVVLDEGKIAGIGTHEELMKNCPTYQEIARSQLSAAELGGEGA
ncbi:MAG: ABC transporter ATP-binding protein/permease [Pseudoflavonifractor capillosus]|uniref:ABC transporter ATP-binding protein n=1 Tax=Pseudoflavonifractor capillosus TaxID=106588 RepID=UPI0023F9B2F8|nr:ABC transporter ATP-binding protein [Pseudoflavonifractor capillosus]MCI5926976.1 ABC transporter ATP-binding protein/permease [Pseudoflavonifractor capillosus]MDY4662258.1 ABC transporter ATP-binding protein [Pseudoflavonifractor capillosus]